MKPYRAMKQSMAISPRPMYHDSIKDWLQLEDLMRVISFAHTTNIEGQNPTGHQSRLSSLQRRKELHWPSVTLKEQHRIVKGLSWYSKQICYHDQLIDVVATNFEDMPAFNKLILNKLLLQKAASQQIVVLKFRFKNVQPILRHICPLNHLHKQDVKSHAHGVLSSSWQSI